MLSTLALPPTHPAHVMHRLGPAVVGSTSWAFPEEALARDLLEAVPEAILVSNAGKRVVFANAKAEALFGACAGELVGRKLDEIVSPGPWAVGHPRSGVEFPLEVRESELRTAGDTLCVLVVRDATAQLEATRALRETEERFRLAFEDAPHGMALMGLSGRFERVNRAFCRLVGYSAEELAKLDFAAITHPDDLAEDTQLAEKLIRGEILSYELEKRYIRKDGRVVVVVLGISLLRDRDGRPLSCIGQAIDVTERKRAEAEVGRLDTKYRMLFDEAADGILITDLDGHYTDVNPAACRLLGYPREELLGMGIRDVIPQADWGRLENDRDHMLVGETVVSEWQVCRKDGVWLAVEVSARILDDGRWQAQMRDVSERHRAAEALRRSEATLARAQRVAGLGIWDWNVLTDEVTRSAELFVVFGRKPDENFKGRGQMRPQIPPDDGARLELLIQRALRENKPYVLEHRVIRPDGTVRVVVHQGEPIFENGRAVRIVGTVLDITDRKRAEEEREQTLLRLQTILEEIPVGTLVISPSGDRVEPNSRALRWIGWRPERLAEYREVVFSADGKRLAADELPGASALRGEGRDWTEYLLRTAGASMIPVVAAEAPIVGTSGGVQGAVVSFQDITPVKELERLRAEWGSIVAHDLRQPLNVLGLRVDFLLRQLGQDAAARKSLEQMRRSVRQLGRMAGDSMDLSSLEAHRLELVREPVDVAELARASVERLPEEDGRPVGVHVRGSVPKCSADPDRVAQVMDNLLSNAVKYGTPNTPITVEVGPADGGVSVAVTNEGPEIPPQDVPRLFARFERADRRRSAVKGVGLGLYITRGLVEAHGGRIGVVSQPGKTTFEFVLPAA